MTTPAERRRNLIWGRETLQELSQDSILPTEWREEAASLLNCYPTLERLQGDDEAALAELQDEFVEVLSAAKWLLMRVQRHASSSEQRKYSLMVVLRHFV